MIPPTSVASDMTPQKRSELGSIACISRLISTTITGIMPAITAFIDSHSGRKDRATALG